ncbi:SusC/RagA family TonB-linked outer membrane protein [Chitinophaga barathri]|nr:TonB-dependent receptor [Chitinophaga barathri]
MNANYLLRKTLLVAAFTAAASGSHAETRQDVAFSRKPRPAWQNTAEDKMQQKTLVQLLKEIHKDYKVDLLYEAKKLPKVKVSFTPSSYENVEEMLRALLVPHGLQAQSVQPNTWAIVPLNDSKAPRPKSPSPAKQEASGEEQSAQPLLRLNGATSMMVSGAMVDTVRKVRITGRITDGENGTPLPGVSIQVKGEMRGTQTDGDGKYTLETAAGKTLQLSLLGYESKEVTVTSSSNIDLTLDVSNRDLNEVVVVGYGSQRKSLVTGAISSIKAAEISTVSSSRIEQALQGRTAGVTVLPVSGSPGSAMRVRIRGTGSNGSSEPLYIIDGMRAGGIEYLDPSEIASVEVLKDAASAAIYGAEGANGVVIITTKTGHKDLTPRIDFSMQYGRQSIKNPMKMMNAEQYSQYLEDAGVTVDRPNPADWKGKTGTMWLDEISQNAPVQRYALNISGGSEKSSYLIGGTIYGQDGVIGGDKARFNRYTVRLNTDHQVKPWLNVGNRLSYAYHKRNGVTEDSEFGSVINNAILLDPIMPVVYTGALPQRVQDAISEGYSLIKDPQGRYYGVSDYVWGEAGNPLAQMDITHNFTTQHKVVGNIFAELKPIEGLTVTSRFGLDAAFQRNHAWTPTFWWSSVRLNTAAGTLDNNENWYNWQWENFATYSRKFGHHDVSIMAGMSSLRRGYDRLNGTTSGMFREDDKFSYPDFVPDDQDRLNGIATQTSMVSYYGRIQYDYKGKYLFNAILRRDGSSLLPPANTWGTFPSLSAGWVASNEGFFPDGVMNYLKLRASWGQNGSIANIRIGDWKSLITTEGIGFPDIDDNFLVGAEPAGLENPYLKWEASEQLDFGADMGFFNNRLSVVVDYYNKLTKGLLTPGTVPGFVGNVLHIVNGGDVRNKGWEFEVSYRNDNSSAFKFEIGANLTTIKNEVVSLNEFVDRIPGSVVGTGWQASWFEQGYPIWYFRGFKTDGIFQSQAQVDDFLKNYTTDQGIKVGDPVPVDTDGNGVISEGDYQFIGSPHPDFVYGGRLTMSYKGFDLMVLVQGQKGNDVLMGFNRIDRPTANRPEFFWTDRWTPENKSNSWFAPNSGSKYAYNSDKMLFDGSYTRVRQLQLGYTLPESLLKRAHIRNARIYGSLDNYFTFTKYKGMDPEAGSNDNNSLGIDRGVYPIPRTAIVGLSFSF